MNDALLGALIGASVTLIPTTLNLFLSHRDQHAQREHEMRLKRFDSLILPRINALRDYQKVLGECMLLDAKSPPSPEVNRLLQAYYSAYEIVYPHVSPETQKAMAAIGEPIDRDIYDISNLNQLLSSDMHRILDEAADPAPPRRHK